MTRDLIRYTKATACMQCGKRQVHLSPCGCPARHTTSINVPEGFRVVAWPGRGGGTWGISR